MVGGNVTNTKITDCQVTGGALLGHVDNSQITRCQVIDGLSLVCGKASETHISDCAVVLEWAGDNSIKSTGSIAACLEGGSVVERCFGMGKFSGGFAKFVFGGIAGQAESSTVRQCAVGPLTLSFEPRYGSSNRRLVNGIFSATLQNNASIDTNPGTDDANGEDGKTVAAARFNQRFFEGTLGWDFDTVWQWDATNNRPILRPNAGAGAAQPTAAASTTPMQDLLTRQVQTNIWL